MGRISIVRVSFYAVAAKSECKYNLKFCKHKRSLHFFCQIRAILLNATIFKFQIGCGSQTETEKTARQLERSVVFRGKFESKSLSGCQLQIRTNLLNLHYRDFLNKFVWRCH